VRTSRSSAARAASPQGQGRPSAPVQFCRSSRQRIDSGDADFRLAHAQGIAVHHPHRRAVRRPYRVCFALLPLEMPPKG